jgi:atypical dual specificity phosphatase
MWTWSLNWGEISPQLVVGACPMTAADVSRIRKGTEVSAILSLQHDECLAYWGIDYDAIRDQAARLGLAIDRCPVRDFDIPNQRERLPYAVAALNRFLAEGHRTYVHCTAGLGRSPLAVLGYLSWLEGRPAGEAMHMILRARPGAVPAWEAYQGCHEDLVARYGARIARRAHELHEKDRRASALENWNTAESQVLQSVLREWDG